MSYIAVASVDELQPGERLLFDVGDKPVVLFNVGNQFYAIQDACSHDNSPLGDGDLEGYEVMCPRHGARFDIRSGQALSMPAVSPVISYPVRVVDGMIEIEI